MRRLVLLVPLAVALAATLPAWASDEPITDPGEARVALERARVHQRDARARSERLERQAAGARLAADKALAQAAALAARVQQGEAALAEAEARFTLAQNARRRLDAALAAKREPVARLVGALETLTRRPVTLAVFQPGSLQDLVHTRAVLAGTVPLVETRTATLRGDLARSAALEKEARTALGDRRSAQAMLNDRRRELLALADSQRRTARRASGDAGREAVKAQELAETARDLGSLLGSLERSGALRSRLAALPGPVLRPANPATAKVPLPAPLASTSPPPARFQLPVDGALRGGFGEAEGVTGAARPGIALVPAPGAQVVAPAAGRVAFAGPYRGYGIIVIIEHGGGWTSLVTGLGAFSVEVGQAVTAGSPLGRAATTRPLVTLELRKGGTPVNPLDHLR